MAGRLHRRAAARLTLGLVPTHLPATQAALRIGVRLDSAHLVSDSALLAHDRARGVRMIAGVDEVGRACLAGPIMAAGVLFDLERLASGTGGTLLAELNDSKRWPASSGRCAPSGSGRSFVSWTAGLRSALGHSEAGGSGPRPGP
jgi:hypothetical protein